MRSKDVSTKRQRIAKLAKQMPELGFTSLNHYLDVDWYREAYRRTRKDRAVGIDDQTAKDYEQNLEANLEDLLSRSKSGTYRAPAVRRVNIPKGRGQETRPIGIPTFEDKVLQRAIVMLLEPIYEQDFLACSYGFRPKRSAHQALDAIWQGTMKGQGCWIIDADISKFFDTLKPPHLREFLQRRVRDGVVRRLIGKWLKAGVMEDGQVHYPTEGTPQGGVISPLLSNIYLHEVLDRWFEETIKPRLTSAAFLVRYADDFVIGCASEADARRIMDVLPKRFAKFGLTIHPRKTRMVNFTRPNQGTKSESFDFLGFKHYWGKSRSGRSIVRRKTLSSRFSRALSAIGEWCRLHRHAPIDIQQTVLNRKLMGHYAYYGITGNNRRLSSFLYEVTRRWRYWLNRRSRLRDMTWSRFARVLECYPLKSPRIVHSIYPRNVANP